MIDRFKAVLEAESIPRSIPDDIALYKCHLMLLTDALHILAISILRDREH